MPQMILFLDDKETSKLEKAMKLWDITSKHEAVKRIIKEFEI